jgi:hypothetical protein
MRECKMDMSGSGMEKVVGPGEHGNELSGLGEELQVAQERMCLFVCLLGCKSVIVTILWVYICNRCLKPQEKCHSFRCHP